MSLNLKRKKLIREGKPIEALGLTFYPILMEHYDEFQTYKSVLSIRLGTLPIKYATMDYFSAIYAISNEKDTDMTGSLFLLLCLSLRISANEKNIHIYGDDKTITKFSVKQDEKTVEITPREFSTIIRPLIAEQNGIELPDESENIELVKDMEEMNALKNRNTKIVPDTDALISSVAYLSNVREREILTWTIREFENRYNAIQRDKMFTLYKQAEMSGMVEFKNGNPYETWCYDTKDEIYNSGSINTVLKAVSEKN